MSDDPFDAYAKHVNLLSWMRVLLALGLSREAETEGRDYLVRCPFHLPKEDMAHRTRLKPNGTFEGCRACRETGDVFRFIHATRRHDDFGNNFTPTYAFIKRTFGIEPPAFRRKRNAHL